MADLTHLVTSEQVREIVNLVGTPTYFYQERLLRERAQEALDATQAFGLTVRYALKANPNRTVLRIFDRMGLHFDASSEEEVYRAISAGIIPSKIQLTAQVIPSGQRLEDLVRSGILLNACSLHQLDQIGKANRGGEISVRINPPQGSGAYAATITGGEDSSFGIWHEEIPLIQRIVRKYDVHVTRLHFHIGSGTDPKIWQEVVRMSAEYIKAFSEVIILNIGGGFKVARVEGEKETNMHDCMTAITEEIREMKRETGREFHVEIEPGTYLMAKAGGIIASIRDVKKTTAGNDFLIVDSGMTDNARPALYGAKHPMMLIAGDERELTSSKVYRIDGQCCESGDTWGKMALAQARIGDFLVMGATGAYCAGMNIPHYNSHPESSEVLIGLDGALRVIREREKLKDLTRNENIPEGY